MKDEILRSMATAPRDGTVIIAVYQGLSALEFTFCGKGWPGDPETPMWLCLGESGAHCEADDKDFFCGWLPVPEDIKPLVNRLRDSR